MKTMVERKMFYGASAAIFEKAYELRLNMTTSEIELWNYLKKNKITGYRFRAQHPISQFIADFYCHKLKLVIEIDGGIHTIAENKEYDEGRTYEMEKLGIKTIRFTNNEVNKNIKQVVQQIIAECNKRKIELKNDIE